MNATSLTWLREVLWLLFTAVFAAIILLPIFDYLRNQYIAYNLLFIVTSVTLFRYTVFLNSTPYLKSVWVRIVLGAVLAIAFWQFIRIIQDFLFAIDNYTILAFLQENIVDIHADEVQSVYAYFKREFIAFSTATIMLIIIFGLRVLASIWGLGASHK